MAGLSENHSKCPQDCFHGKHILWKKNTFPFVFHILGRKFSSFRQKNSSTIIKTALVSRFFNRIYANFSSDFTQVSINWSVRTAIYVSTELFPGEATSLIKNIFQLVFHNLGGNFSGFWQNFSSTVVRTAYVPRFFNRTYANFSRTLRKILLASLSELNSLCPQDCFHGKHLLWKKNTFLNVFHNLGG